MCMAGVSVFTGILHLSPAPVLFRQRRPFYSLPQLLMQVGLWATAWALCGQLWVPTGLCCGDVQSGTGVRGRVLRWAGTEFLSWGSVLASCVVVPGRLLGFLLVWLLSCVRCRAWCRHAVSARCAAVARRGLLSGKAHCAVTVL